ncbi:hypothetical protein [Microbulbifer sp.]|uniref:hypothetical protein n=1 Tax=Microbulbifer sp. TaxID=1908541 RepID=UPI00258FB506|nr:hypothetical protein [Microbulbifer sp.]
MKKGTCSACNRQIQNTGFDICMYCGAELQDDQKFSESEKIALKKQDEALKSELRQKREKLDVTSISNYGFDGGLDFGGSDSGCE